MEAKLIKNADAYSVKINNEYVAFANEDFVGYATQKFRDNLLGKLSLSNCQAIEHGYGYDLDELAILCTKEEDTIVGNQKMAIGFIKGFQKALEILGDKKFSEEDVILIAEYVRVASQSTPDIRTKDLFDEYQSVQQTEFDVEIVMEDSFAKNDEVYVDETNAKGNYNTHSKIPKLDADGCLILKII